MAQHIRQGLTETHAMLLYRADDLSAAIEAFLLGPCTVKRAKAAGDFRRRVDVVEELVFVIETDDFPAVIARMQRYGGRTPLVSSGEKHAVFALSSGLLRLKHPGYEIDIDRIIAQARQNGCFFEINSSPDRLDLSADNARRGAGAGVMISISTDSHSDGELGLIRCGIDQARRAGLEKAGVLSFPLPRQRLNPCRRRLQVNGSHGCGMGATSGFRYAFPVLKEND